MITIDQESKRFAKLPISIDNFANKYKTENDLFVFTSPSFWTIEKNLFYLLRNSKEISFNQKYKYKPDYLSFDEYGTVVLANMLMYVNNVFCLEEFDLSTVVIPSYQSIITVCQDKFSLRDISKIDSVNW